MVRIAIGSAVMTEARAKEPEGLGDQ